MRLYTVALTLALSTPFAAIDADEIDDLMEQARIQGQSYQRIRDIINTEPDQNVRLAAFDLLMMDEDPHIKSIGIDAGLASTDKLLQAAAFKLAVFDLERIPLRLEVAESKAKVLPKFAKRIIDNQANIWTMKIATKDNSAGTFGDRNSFGEFNGLSIYYSYKSYDLKAILHLKNGDEIEGDFFVQGYKFKATGKIR